MKILSFDISGKFAHFRKYYANNTAMTFSLPPRTTIIGIIASAMGLKKDSYYEDFSSENIRIGINILSEIKKSFHRTNMLRIISLDDFRGKKGRVQTPFEIISGIDIKKDEVKYRIFVSATEKGQNIFDEIQSTFLNKKFVYNPTLGTANFTAQITNIQLFDKSRITEIQAKNEFIEINSACLSENVEKIHFEKNDKYKHNMIEEELMPADFIADNDRELKKMNRILFTSGNIPLSVKITAQLYKIKINEYFQIIQFLD